MYIHLLILCQDGMIRNKDMDSRDGQIVSLFFSDMNIARNHFIITMRNPAGFPDLPIFNIRAGLMQNETSSSATHGR